jgi:hypothetical protein
MTGAFRGRFHDVHDVRDLASIRAAVLRHREPRPAAGHQHGGHHLAQRQRHARLPLLAQGEVCSCSGVIARVCAITLTPDVGFSCT